MFKWLTKRFEKKDLKPTIENRSRDRSDNLTDDERAYMAWAGRNDEPVCPDCQSGQLLFGPRGGCAVNTICSGCTSEFNLTFFDGCVIGERISNAKAGREELIPNELKVADVPVH